MRKSKRRALESALRQTYKADRSVSGSIEKRSLALAMSADLHRLREMTGRRAVLAFLDTQVRFVSWRVWAAQAGIVALMVMLCALRTDEQALLIAVSMLAVASVSIGIPWVAASKKCGMFELEMSCRFDGRHVALARLLILGTSSALALMGIVLIVPALTGAAPLAVILRAVVPYFLTCAGCLTLVRTSRQKEAAVASFVWAAFVAACALAAQSLVPVGYDFLSLAAWIVVAAGGFTWSLTEVLLLALALKDHGSARSRCVHAFIG